MAIVWAESNFAAVPAIPNKFAMEIDAAAREARRTKIKELEASLFGDGNNGDSLWNQQ